MSERMGRNPAGRGKNGSKRHITADGAGAHPVLAVTGAKGHDVSQLERILDSIIIERPDSFEDSRRICLDAGYAVGPALEIAAVRGFIPRIGSRRQDQAEKIYSFKKKRVRETRKGAEEIV
jgi:hypothetical protein